MSGSRVVSWLLASDEPAARWIARSALVDLTPAPHGPASQEVEAEHRAVLADPGTRALLDRLPDWESGADFSGHQSPAFVPNLLSLLADMGVRGGEDERVERVLDAMLRHQLPDGRFASFGRARAAPTPAWGSLLCDTHAITDVLLRFGRGGDPRVTRALATTLGDLGPTSQGTAWPCRPDEVRGFRGPGRKDDVCPQATVEALRVWSAVPGDQRPPEVHAAARVMLHVWRRRADEQPYMFGHGYRFKVVKWPTTWYDVHGVLDTLGRYPALWRGPGADPQDRRSIVELVACLVAYNLAPDGTVTPQSCYRGFEEFSFGQKKRPSPFATARLHEVLRRFGDLDAAEVDVMTLGSSRGGSGTPRPPRVRGPR